MYFKIYHIKKIIDFMIVHMKIYFQIRFLEVVFGDFLLRNTNIMLCKKTYIISKVNAITKFTQRIINYYVFF